MPPHCMLEWHYHFSTSLYQQWYSNIFLTKSNWEELLVYRDALAHSQRKQKKMSNQPLKQLQCQCSDSVKSEKFNKIRIIKTLPYKAKHSDNIFLELTKDRHLTFWPYSKNVISLGGEEKHEKYGVPQSSVIIPLPFPLFIFHLLDILYLYWYTDDTQLYVPLKTWDHSQIIKSEPCCKKKPKTETKNKPIILVSCMIVLFGSGH